LQAFRAASPTHSLLRESNLLAKEQQVVDKADKGKGKAESKTRNHVLRPAIHEPSRTAALSQLSKPCAEYPKLLHPHICGVGGGAAAQTPNMECNLSEKSVDSEFVERDDEGDESEKREEDVTFDDSLQSYHSPLDVLSCFISNCVISIAACVCRIYLCDVSLMAIRSGSAVATFWAASVNCPPRETLSILSSGFPPPSFFFFSFLFPCCCCYYSY
jgi:hypothetical protein